MLTFTEGFEVCYISRFECKASTPPAHLDHTDALVMIFLTLARSWSLMRHHVSTRLINEMEQPTEHSVIRYKRRKDLAFN